MAGLIQVLSKLLGRWWRQQETALWQVTERKTAAQRIAGFSKSERVDAKFFLFALAPFAPLIIADQLGWSRGILWHAWFWLSAVWAVSIVGIGLASYWRALRQCLRQKQ